MFSLSNTTPDAYAKIKGNPSYPEIEGTVKFYGVHGGTVVVADIKNLPTSNQFHGFHIHEGERCSGTEDDPFKNAGGHYNPTETLHPNHAGDLPPILSANGMAYSVFYTTKFYPEDIVEKTVILHENAEDFKTQPSGNAGMMIACGEIKEKSEV